MDRKIVKLEVAYGSDRQHVVVKRNDDLIVSDLMEDILKKYGIPMEEQVIFHKGTNLCDFPKEKLEMLGIVNNQQIRLNRDSELPSRSPRSNMSRTSFQTAQSNALDPISYLKEISPTRVPDPTPYQIQMYKYKQETNSTKLNPIFSHGKVI